MADEERSSKYEVTAEYPFTYSAQAVMNNILQIIILTMLTPQHNSDLLRSY